MKPGLSDRKARNGILLPLSQTFLLRLLSVITQSVVPVYLVDYLGYTTRSIGVPIALIWVGNAVGALLAFYVLRRVVFNNMLGFLLISLSFLGFGSGSANHNLVPLLVFTGGVGSGCVQPLLIPIVHMWSLNGRRYSGVGLYSVALSLGLIMGPFVASFADSSTNYSTLYLALSLLAAAFFVLSGLFRGEGIISSVPKNTSSSFRRTLSNRAFIREFTLNFLYSLTLPVVLSYTTVIGESDYGVSTSLMYRLMTLMFLISLLLRIVATSSKSERFERKMLFPAAILPISISALAFHVNPLVYATGLVLFSIPHAFVYPWSLFNTLQSSKPDSLPAVSYLFSLSSGAAETASPPVASYFVGIFGGSAAFYAALPFGIAAAVWAAVNYKGTKGESG
jgi:MFS family permease